MPRPAFSVRTPRISDIPGMVRVAAQAFTETVRRPRIGRTFVEKFMDRSIGWSRVAVENAEVIGYLAGERMPGGAKIGQFAVHPAHWRKGVGRAMVQSMERSARRKKLPLIMVGTTYAKGFYEKCGFHNVATIHRLARTLPGSCISPSPLTTEDATLDNVSRLIDDLPRTPALEFIDSFYGCFMSPGGRGLYTLKGKKIVGCAVLFPHEVCSDFARANVIYARDPEVALHTLQAVEHMASTHGYMWLGVSVPRISARTLAFLRANGYTTAVSDPMGSLKPSMLKHLEAEGYTDLQLGLWSTLYWLVKDLA